MSTELVEAAFVGEEDGDEGHARVALVGHDLRQCSHVVVHLMIRVFFLVNLKLRWTGSCFVGSAYMLHPNMFTGTKIRAPAFSLTWIRALALWKGFRLHAASLADGEYRVSPL